MSDRVTFTLNTVSSFPLWTFCSPKSQQTILHHEITFQSSQSRVLGKKNLIKFLQLPKRDQLLSIAIQVERPLDWQHLYSLQTSLISNRLLQQHITPRHEKFCLRSGLLTTAGAGVSLRVVGARKRPSPFMTEVHWLLCGFLPVWMRDENFCAQRLALRTFRVQN